MLLSEATASSIKVLCKRFRDAIPNMTDKELAEEYRKKLKQRLIDEDDFERLENFDENVEEAFLAGLKLGRQQS